jgi:hypothetical protein
MNLRTRRSLAASLGLAVLLAPAAALGQSPAEDPEWNRTQVAGLAGRLVTALDALLEDPGITAKQATAMQQREHDAAVSSIRELTRLVKDLKRRLDAGYEHDEIRPFWDGIELLRGDIGAYARNSWVPESTRNKVAKARELLDTLAGYFQDV